MANLVRGLLPLEETKWIRPEEATNGKFENYAGNNGFTGADWPQSYTLDLGSSSQIVEVRILLWDGLGHSENKDGRKYKFELNVSADGINFHNLFTNQQEDGGNGWFIFEVQSLIRARYVQFNGLFNTANPQIHLVEFQAFDTKPKGIPPGNNHHRFRISGSLPDESYFDEKVQSAIERAKSGFELLNEQGQTAKEIVDELQKSKSFADIQKQTSHFSKEAEQNNTRSFWWLGIGATCAVIFGCLVRHFLYHDNHVYHIIWRLSFSEITQTHTSFVLSFYYAGKLVLISTVLFVLSWCLRNFRSERHNFVINKQKANSLSVALDFLKNEKLAESSRNQILIEAMKVVFSHQQTGLSQDENAAPNIFKTLVSKGLEKK